MALSSSNAQRQLSDGNSQGTVMGVSALDKIGFYGVTSAVAQPASFSSLSSSTGPLISSIALALNALGLINCSTVAA